MQDASWKLFLLYKNREKGLSFDFFQIKGKIVLSSCTFVNLGLLSSWLILNLVLRTNYVRSKQWIPKLGYPMHTIPDWPWSCLRVENWDFWPQGVQKIGYKRVKVRNRIGTIQKTTKSLRDNFCIINKSNLDRFWVIFLKKIGEILLDGFFQF